MKPTAPAAGEVKAISNDDVVGVLPASGERMDEPKTKYPRNETTSQKRACIKAHGTTIGIDLFSMITALLLQVIIFSYRWSAIKLDIH